MLTLGARLRLKFLVRHGRRYWADSRRACPRMSERRRIAHLVAGFDPLEADWYAQAGVDLPLCLGNAHRETVLHGVNGHHAVLLDDKLMFALAMEAADLPHPTVFGVTRHGRWHWRDVVDGGDGGGGSGEAGFAAAITARGRGVLKPIHGKKGLAIRFPAAWPEACGPWPDGLLATAYAVQAPYAAAIFPHTLNTIRIVTLNSDGTDPFILGASHRFGAAATGGVDNFSAGGVAARVDRESGRMDPAFAIGPGNRLVRLERHPDTGTPIAGTTVADWPAVLALVRRLCRTFPWLPYVGWDIAVTADGPVVIEGNSHPSLRILQLYGPLLADREAARHIARLIAPRHPVQARRLLAALEATGG